MQVRDLPESRGETLAHHQTKEDGSVEYDICGLKYLDNFFAGWKVADITVDSITAFKNKRLTAGLNGSTVNRTLALLSRMLNLAMQSGKLQVIPYIGGCAEGEPRQGYCSPENFAKLLSRLPEECRLYLKLFSWTGARPSKIERIGWDMVDLGEHVIRIPGAFTKTVIPEHCRSRLTWWLTLKKCSGTMGRCLIQMYLLKDALTARQDNQDRRSWDQVSDQVPVAPKQGIAKVVND